MKQMKAQAVRRKKKHDDFLIVAVLQLPQMECVRTTTLLS